MHREEDLLKRLTSLQEMGPKNVKSPMSQTSNGLYMTQQVSSPKDGRLDVHDSLMEANSNNKSLKQSS